MRQQRTMFERQAVLEMMGERLSRSGGFEDPRLDWPMSQKLERYVDPEELRAMMEWRKRDREEREWEWAREQRRQELEREHQRRLWLAEARYRGEAMVAEFQRYHRTAGTPPPDSPLQQRRDWQLELQRQSFSVGPRGRCPPRDEEWRQWAGPWRASTHSEETTGAASGSWQQHHHHQQGGTDRQAETMER